MAAALCPACGLTRLSRYNPGRLCAPCFRRAALAPQARMAARPPALSWLWDSPQWRDALARVNIPLAVTTFRLAAGLSQHQLAAVVGMSQSTLSLIETGGRDSLYDIRALLNFADLAGIPRDALLPLIHGGKDKEKPT